MLCAVLVLTLLAGRLCAEPAKVKLVNDNQTYKLLVDGQPFFIKGVGGDASKELLKQLGGNSFRTWGVGDDTQAKLDEAQKLGLKVTLGIWLGHERHGFNYSNADQVADQYAKARKAILQYKDHPALLMWALGNEMEGFKEGDNPAIWSAVQAIAATAHQLDPNHPTMTVIAEIGGQRVKSINRFCPDIDIIGINSYGGLPSIPKRYRDAGGLKPYVITEFGPPGTWEVGMNPWGKAPEMTSTQKGDFYRNSYQNGVAAAPGQCLGAYAFAWGSKQEATSTWLGMLLPDGTRLASVDVMEEFWTGHKPAHLCPTIEPIRLEGPDVVAPGATLKASVKVASSDNTPLKVTWKLFREVEKYSVGGDVEESTQEYPQAIVRATDSDAQLTMPADGGIYRLYAIARDAKGFGATANLLLKVTAPTPAAQTGKTNLPLVIYGDSQTSPTYIPSGWLGKIDAIAMDEKSATTPHSGPTCLKAEFRAPDNFGGIIWQNPANDWGDKAGGLNLTGAKRLTFWARGEQGGEKVDFKYGILGKDKKFHDSSSGELKTTLTKDWRQYTLDLAGKDLSCLKTAFGWSLAGQGKPVVFYVDDVQYE